MNYEDMSDKELDAKLTELVLLDTYKDAKSVDYDGTQNCFWVERCGFTGWPVVNHCSDWNATMQLAVNHKVGIKYRDFPVGNWFAETAVTEHCNQNHSSDKDPLRAIVICLIRVLEAEQCQISE